MIDRCKFIHNLPCEQVSDRITELKTENAKLKEHVRWLKKGDILHVLTDQEYIDQWKHERLMQSNINALDDENTKLRKFATLAWQIMTHNEPMHVWQGMVDDARKLGIEVKDDD